MPSGPRVRRSRPHQGDLGRRSRARSPWADDPAVEARHPRLGPDAGQAAVYHAGSKQMIRRFSHDGELRIEREPAVPDGTSWMPELRRFRSIACVGFSLPPGRAWGRSGRSRSSRSSRQAQQMVEASEASSDWQGMSGFLVPLLDPDVPMRPMARLVLAVGLSVKQPELAGLATDVLIAAIEDGRLDTDSLGESLAIAWQMRIQTSRHRQFNETDTFRAAVRPIRETSAMDQSAL